MHATMFGSRRFALFPLMLMVFSAVGTFFASVLLNVLGSFDVAFIAHYSLLLFGASVGAFGLLGREVMNRRFGQASLLAYASRSLPISGRAIMTSFYLKDVLYYLVLWILPLLAGVAIAAPLLSYGHVVPLLAVSLPLSFLVGLAAVFFLSTIYVHSPPLLAAMLAGGGIAAWLASQAWGVNPALMLFPFSFFLHPSLFTLVASGVIIALCSAVSVLFMRVDYPSTERHYPPALSSLAARLPVSHPWLVAKDFLDFRRSEGGLGKIAFGFLLPAAMVWLLFYVLVEFIPMLDFLPVFALFLGIIASSMYNWLTEFDSFAGYAFLPVSVDTVISSKVESYTILNGVAVAVLVAAAAASGNFSLLLPAMCVFLGMSAYVLSVTVYLMGLHPTVLIYDVTLFALYTAMVTPMAVLLLFMAALTPWLLCSALLLVPFAWYILRHVDQKWNSWELPDR